MAFIRGLALSALPSYATENSPIILWQTVGDLTNFEATSYQGAFPPTNLANEATDLLWKSDSTADQYVTINASPTFEIDGLGVARHNFGSGVIFASVETITSDIGAVWTEVVAPVQVANDAPILFHFTKQFIAGIRLKLSPQGSTKPQAAVIYAGPLLFLQRRIYVGHTPINYGRNLKTANGLSENGEFLGRVVQQRTLNTFVDMKNLTPAWYRTYLDPYILDSEERPFFFAWRPETYPFEVGYCWRTNNAQPMNQLPNGMMQIRIEMEGIA